MHTHVQKQAVGACIFDILKNAVAAGCRERPRDESYVALQIFINLSSTCLQTFAFLGSSIRLRVLWVRAVYTEARRLCCQDSYSTTEGPSLKAKMHS